MKQWKLLPDPPTWDANSLDDAYHHLSHEDEKESHEVEWAVGPAIEGVIDRRNKACQQGTFKRI